MTKKSKGILKINFKSISNPTRNAKKTREVLIGYYLFVSLGKPKKSENLLYLLFHEFLTQKFSWQRKIYANYKAIRIVQIKCRS